MSLTKEIQMAVGKMQVLKSHYPVVENLARALCGYEMDVVSFSKSGYLYEFEVKISRADFKADAKKGKMEVYGVDNRVSPNYFSYVCPDGMIKPEEIDSRAGLFYYKDGQLDAIRWPKFIHKDKHDRSDFVERINRLITERHFLGCARLTYENRLAKESYERWKKEKEKRLRRNK